MDTRGWSGRCKGALKACDTLEEKPKMVAVNLVCCVGDLPVYGK